MGGEADTDVGDEVRPPRRAFFDDVEHVPPVHDREVCALPHPVDEVGQEWVAEPAQRLLASESAGKLERGDTEPIAAGLGEVHDEPTLLQNAEQVVDG